MAYATPILVLRRRGEVLHGEHQLDARRAPSSGARAMKETPE
jgi:hypothetical protein